MPSASSLIQSGPVVLGDGAIGTMLQTQGLRPGEAPELWMLAHPERVRAVHAAYAAAGARWATTNTFGANRGRLAGSGLEERVAELNAAAVREARAGAPAAVVMGAVGPTSAGSESSWERAYAEQIEALAEAGVDAILVETIVRLDEGAAAVRAAARAGILVVAAFTPGEDGGVLDGTAPEAAAEVLLAAGASAVGVNCGGGPETLLGPVRRLVRAGIAPVLASPNAGLPDLVGGRARYSLSPDGFARAAIQFREAGARLIAGCCGTTPRHIRAAADRIGR